ncbi:MAG TPA: arginase family protein [Gemmatimonadales bacterium]|nr:arginase family protein [Gemmatimonadales bacterium]
MDVQILAVPYDTAQRGWRMGAGPQHLLAKGLVEHLAQRGHQVRVELVLDDPAQRPAEIRTAFALMRRVAERVKVARAEGRFPLVLSGNCNIAAGTLAGMAPDHPSVFWFDAHADLNTPETTRSGFLDGMALATACGLCWRELTATIPGFAPLPLDAIALLGARHMDPPERALLERSPITFIPPGSLDEALPRLLSAPRFAATRGYLHCDLDVLDPRVGQANPYAVPGGLSIEDVTGAIRRIGKAVPLAAGALTAYAPESDSDGAISRAGFTIAETILETVKR